MAVPAKVAFSPKPFKSSESKCPLLNSPKFQYFFASLAAWSTLVMITAIYYYFCVPEFLSKFKTPGLIFIGYDIVTWFLSLGCMVRTMITDPGIMPKATEDEEDHWLYLYGQNEKYNYKSAIGLNVNGWHVNSKWCRTCHFFRPPRSSHCSVCDRCIENFDHHCPWVYNCIGRRNYKPYMYLILWVNLHAINILLMSILYIACTSDGRFDTKIHIVCYLYLAVGVIAGYFVGNLAYMHSRLITMLQTTKENACSVYQKIGNINPVCNSRGRNWYLVMCSPLYPSYRPADTLYVSEKYPPSVISVDETNKVNDQAL